MPLWGWVCGCGCVGIKCADMFGRRGVVAEGWWWGVVEGFGEGGEICKWVNGVGRGWAAAAAEV